MQKNDVNYVRYSNQFADAVSEMVARGLFPFTLVGLDKDGIPVVELVFAKNAQEAATEAIDLVSLVSVFQGHQSPLRWWPGRQLFHLSLMDIKSLRRAGGTTAVAPSREGSR